MNTTSSSPSPDVLLPQELKDSIISHLYPDRPALLACCLAHRTLLAPAQIYLFRSIQLSRARDARRLRRALKASPHLRIYVHKMTIEEVHPSEPDWIGRADVELVTIVSELPHLAALALRAWGTVNYKNFRALRDVLRSLCPVALELRCLRSIPPQLFAGARALRLDRVHIDRQAAQCICAPVALELCSILQNDFAALQLDVRKLTRLRLDGVPIEAGELMARSATTLQVLEVGTSIPAPQASLPALRVLALRDLESVRQWLRAAPGTRHLIVHIALQVRLAVSKESGDLVAWSASTVPRGVMLDADTIAEGKALEVVTVVTYSGQVDKRRWQDVAVSHRYGENNVEIRCMRIPQSRVAPMVSRPSLVDPDILDENWV